MSLWNIRRDTDAAPLPDWVDPSTILTLRPRPSSAEAVHKLKALGLREPLDTVVEVVGRIKNGYSLYSIYNEIPPFVSKGTVRKLRDMFKHGKLNFVLELMGDCTQKGGPRHMSSSKAWRQYRLLVRTESWLRCSHHECGGNDKQEPVTVLFGFSLCDKHIVELESLAYEYHFNPTTRAVWNWITDSGAKYATDQE